MRDRTDQELIALCRQGRRDAFNEVVRRYQDKVYWLVRRLVADHDDALDIAQDVFVRAYHGVADFRGDSQIFTWLYTIARNLSLNHLRRKNLRNFFHIDSIIDSAPSDAADAPDTTIEQSETRTLIEAAIDKLPAKQKQVFLLRYYEEMPYEQIAALLNTSVGGLKANYFHAVRKIEEHVKHAMHIPSI